MEFRKEKELMTLKRGRGDYSLQLNALSWGNNKAALDLRIWHGNSPCKGVCIHDDEVDDLIEALKDYKG